MHLVLISASLLAVIAKRTAESVDPACGEPPDVSFALLTEKSDDPYTIGATVTYGCQFGYVASGQGRNLKCVRSGSKAQWTEPQFMCIPQSCGDPGLVSNGQRVGSLFTFPNSVKYNCDPGYKLRGIATRYCQTSGSWSGRLPTCEVITCEPPKSPENGHVTATSFDYGSELSYKCDKGFSLNTDENVYCTEYGHWSLTNVTCIETVCEIPQKPEYGYVHFRGSEERPRAGSIAIFSCEDGTVADGPTTSKCLDIGVWTFPPPKCLEPCKIRYVANGGIWKYVQEGRYYKKKVLKRMNIGTSVEDNEELHLRCSDGFEVAGTGDSEKKVFCGKGKWSLEPVCEPASCSPNVPYAANAEAVEGNLKHGGTVLYDCHSDYKKMTAETVICDHGVWKGDPPKCKSTKCSVDALISPGLLRGTEAFYRDGEVLEATCDRGYQLAAGNNGQVKCQDGIWIGFLSPCIPVNCTEFPPPIEHGRAIDPSNMAHGSVVRYVCDHPYILEQSLVECAFGEWKGKPPQCKDSRCYLNDLKNLNHVSSKSQPSTLPYNRLNVICDEGYSATLTMPRCRDGAWDSYYTSLCEESDCRIPRINGGSVDEETFGDWSWNWRGVHWQRSRIYSAIPTGSIVSSGHVLWFSCNRPYSVHGDGKERVQIKCLKGRWSTDLQCLLDGQRLVTSTTTTVPKWFTSVTELSRSSSAIPTDYVPPSTTPDPRSEERTSSVDIDREKPVTVFPSLPPPEPTAENCFCEYPVEDSNVVAQADGNRLIYRDRVRNGSTVSFHCLHVGYHRFRGRREITCIDCLPWHSGDFPSCVPPQSGDAAIVFDRDVNVLSDGSVEIHKGQSVNFTCFAVETAKFPDWNVPETPSIAYLRERRERKDYRDVVYLTHLEILDADYENEGTYECSIEGDHETMLQVIVTDPDLRCPELPTDAGIITEYEMERRQNSKVLFSCPKKGQEVVGKPILTCLRDGQWSDPPPHCSGVRCKKLEAKDLLQIDYSRDREVGGYAAFHCPIPGKRSGVSLTTCLENGLWADPTPTCRIPDCTVNDLLIAVPQNVLPVVDSVQYSSLPYNSTVKLACTNGLTAVSNPVAKCAEDATWKIDTVECASGCQPPVKPPASKLIFNPEKNIYKIGEKLTLSCPPGMVLSKESQVIMCFTYGWSDPEIPECEEKDNYKSFPGNKRIINQANLKN